MEEEEIETQTEALREKLVKGGGKEGGGEGGKRGQFKPHQVHELAKAKIEESEKLRRALGIRSDYEEGQHWRDKEQRLRESVGEGEGRGR